MKRKNLSITIVVLIAAFLVSNPGCAVAAAGSGSEIQKPDAIIGHPVGADYKLARYEKITEYFKHVAENSPRVNVRDIGMTTEGRHMIIAEITDDASLSQTIKAMTWQKQIADPRLIKDERQQEDSGISRSA